MEEKTISFEKVCNLLKCTIECEKFKLSKLVVVKDDSELLEVCSRIATSALNRFEDALGKGDEE